MNDIREDVKKEESKGLSDSGGKFIMMVGAILIALEIWKQFTVWFVEFQGRYEVWYFPFQLCSMPLYLIPAYGLLKKYSAAENGRSVILKKTILTFLQDYGFLGGFMSLVVHDGLIHPGHMILTAHGFIWHILLLLLSVFIYRRKLSFSGIKEFGYTVPLFLGLAAVAEIINITLHKFGDCDMFYISPYHNSSQLVFCEIDRLIGRPAGILVYLLSIVLGAFIIHGIFYLANKLLTI